jgi:hypothetical protein
MKKTAWLERRKHNNVTPSDNPIVIKSVVKMHLYSVHGYDEITKFIVDRKVEGNLAGIVLPWPNNYKDVDEDEYFSVEYDEHMVSIGSNKDYNSVILGAQQDSFIIEKSREAQRKIKEIIPRISTAVLEEKIGYITMLLSIIMTDFETKLTHEAAKLGRTIRKGNWRSSKILDFIRFV